MPAKLSKALIIFALICAIGGHWGVLQSIAWLSMVVSYSQDGTLSEALAKTFDGRHPCNLCKAVQEGKKSEKKQELVKLETKLDLWLSRHVVLLYPPATLPILPGTADPARPRANAPPSPPPRAA